MTSQRRFPGWPRSLRRRLTLEQAKANLRGKLSRNERRRAIHRLWRNLMTMWPAGILIPRAPESERRRHV